jgi:hypothetical protein
MVATNRIKNVKSSSKAQNGASERPAYVVENQANRELDPVRKRQILEMAAQLRAKQGGPDEVHDEDLATKIAYIRPIRDALLRWAEEQAGFGHIDLNCFSDGSAAIAMEVCEPDNMGLRVVVQFNITVDG